MGQRSSRVLTTVGSLLAALVLGGVTIVPTSATPAPERIRPSAEPVHHKSYREVIPESKVGFEMMAIPGGTFLMGGPPAERGRRADEGPQHPVQVGPFWMGKVEVTWDEFDQFSKGGAVKQRPNENVPAKQADAITRPTTPYIDETYGYGREGHPVIGISHHAAMEYCRWLSLRTGKGYRLPTEAEWEWACRAGSQTAYSFGDDPGQLGGHGWFDRNADERTHPVGKKRPNAWGLHDMHGNVAEWCLDHYRKDSYGTRPLHRLTLAPVLVPTADRFPHVVRGGSWADPAAACGSAARRGSDPSWNRFDPGIPRSIWWLANSDFVGFRVVRAVAEPELLQGICSWVTRESN